MWIPHPLTPSPRLFPRSLHHASPPEISFPGLERSGFPARRKLWRFLVPRPGRGRDATLLFIIDIYRTFVTWGRESSQCQLAHHPLQLWVCSQQLSLLLYNRALSILSNVLVYSDGRDVAWSSCMAWLTIKDVENQFKRIRIGASLSSRNSNNTLSGVSRATNNYRSSSKNPSYSNELLGWRIATIKQAIHVRMSGSVITQHPITKVSIKCIFCLFSSTLSLGIVCAFVFLKYDSI